MTNRELGDAIGVSPSMASRIRNGNRLPGVATLSRLAGVLDLDPAFLMNAHVQGAAVLGGIVRSALEHRPAPEESAPA